MALHFNTYEELSEFCYPFEKNLGKRHFSTDEKHELLDCIAHVYRQKLDEIAERLGSLYTLLVHATSDSSFWGRCWGTKRIIELSPSLICYPPILLTNTIIHELTHYQQCRHGKKFYQLMEQNVHKLGLQDVLYGWQPKGIMYPTSAFQIVQEIDKKAVAQIYDFFHLSYTPSRTKWPKIPNGSSLNLQNDWVSFTVPPYVNIPRVQGILSRAELVYHAENSFRDYAMEAAEKLGMDLTDVSIMISDRCGFDKNNRCLCLPIWLIGMQPDMTKRFIATLLTQMQDPDKDFRKRLEYNLCMLGLETVPAPCDHCLLQLFISWENSLFDETGRQRIRYQGQSLPKKVNYTIAFSNHKQLKYIKQL